MCSEFGRELAARLSTGSAQTVAGMGTGSVPGWIADFDRDADRQHLLFEASGSELARLVAEIETTHVSTAATTTPISVVN